MSIVQVTVVCSSPKAKTLSKPEPVQTGIKLCPQGIAVWTGFTVYIYIYSLMFSFVGDHSIKLILFLTNAQVQSHHTVSVQLGC